MMEEKSACSSWALPYIFAWPNPRLWPSSCRIAETGTEVGSLQVTHTRGWYVPTLPNEPQGVPGGSRRMLCWYRLMSMPACIWGGEGPGARNPSLGDKAVESVPWE